MAIAETKLLKIASRSVNKLRDDNQRLIDELNALKAQMLRGVIPTTVPEDPEENIYEKEAPLATKVEPEHCENNNEEIKEVK